MHGKKYMNVQEVADYAGITTVTVYRWTKKGIINQVEKRKNEHLYLTKEVQQAVKYLRPNKHNNDQQI